MLHIMLHRMLNSVFQILYFMSHILKCGRGMSCRLHPKLFLRIRKKGNKSKEKIELKIICFCPKISGNQQELNRETQPLSEDPNLPAAVEPADLRFKLSLTSCMTARSDCLQ